MSRLELKNKTIFHAYNYFDDKFCDTCISSLTPNVDESEEINYTTYTLYLSDYLMDYIKNFFIDLKKFYPELPSLICNRKAEVSRYDEGEGLDNHYDNPYYKEVMGLFVTVINLNDGYQGGLEFELFDFKLEGKGSICFTPSTFLTTHKVSQIKNGYRYSLMLELNYSNLLSSEIYNSLSQEELANKEWVLVS